MPMSPAEVDMGGPDMGSMFSCMGCDSEVHLGRTASSEWQGLGITQETDFSSGEECTRILEFHERLGQCPAVLLVLG